MAITENTITSNTTVGPHSFTFPYMDADDVKVTKTVADGTVTTLTKVASSPGATEYTQATTSITLGAALVATDKLRIYRETSDSDLTATFYPGSAIRSADLNDNFTQNLYTTQEVVSRYLDKGGLGTMTGDLKLGKDVDVTFEGAAENDYETTLTITDPTADRTITLPNETGTVVTTASTNVIDSDHYVDGSIDNVHLADDAVDSDEIAAGAIDLAHMSANSVDSDQYVDGSIDRVHLEADIIDGTKLADNAVDSEHYVDGSIDLAHMSANSVDSDQYVDGSIDSAHIANDQVDSQHYAAGSIDLEHMSANSVDSDQYVDGSIDLAHMSANSVDSDQYVDGSIDRVHLAADIVNGDKIDDNSIDSEHYVDGSIDAVHIASNAVTTVKIDNDAVNADKIGDNVVNSEHYAAGSIDTEHIADANITTIKIADVNVTTGKIADNAVTIAKLGCEETTLTNTSNTAIPTSKAVSDYVVNLLNDAGGFVPILDDQKFPNTNPDPDDGAGTIISIADAGGLVVNGSGVSTTGRTLGGSTVTINGIDSSLHNTTIAAGKGMLVQTTTTLNTYDYHRLLVDEAGVASAQTLVSDFNERYRVNAGEPSSHLTDGDLVFDTNANKMKVYDASASAWKEVTSAGDFKYLFLCPAGGTGAPTLNGSIATYDLRESSNSGSAASVTSAAQLMVSINGVVQKANTGTSAPAEGFALVDSNTIIFGANLASGDSVFIVQFGSALTINEPGDGTVTTAKIGSAQVTTAKIADLNVTTGKIADDAVTGAKLSNDVTIANLLSAPGGHFTGNVTPSSGEGVEIFQPATGVGAIQSYDRTNSDWDALRIKASQLEFSTEGTERLRVLADGNVGIGTALTDDFGTNHRVVQIHSGSTANSYLSLTNTTTGDQGAAAGLNLIQYGNETLINNRSDGYMAFQTDDTERMRITSTGKLQVYKGTAATGKTSGSEALTVGNGGGNHRFAVYPDGSTVIGGTGDIGDYNILLQHDGAGTFKAKTVVGATPDWASATSTGIEFNPAAATNWLGIKNASTVTATNTAFQITYGTTTTAKIYNNGAATFQGELVVGDTNPVPYPNIGTDDTFAYFHHAQDGGNCGIQIANNAAAGSSDESATIHLSPMFGGHGVYFTANREGDFSSAANSSSSLDVKVNNANTVTTALSISKTGAATFASTVSDSKGNLRSLPQNTQAGAYTLVAADAGKHIYASGNINTGADNVFSAGDAVTIVNNTASNLTITRGITTMFNAAAGDTNSATYTLAARGMVTILFVAGDEARIAGGGLS